MKKILIGILILILLALGIIIAVKGMSIGKFQIYSIKQIKAKNQEMKSDLDNANKLTKSTYFDSIDKLEMAVKKLSESKEKYKSKTENMGSLETVNTNQIKKYKIEFLWTIIGNYATKEGVTLTMDVKNNKGTESYSLDFSVVGNYIAITDFIYDLENDENLNFVIENFKIGVSGATITSSSSSTNNTTGTTNKAATDKATTDKNKDTVKTTTSSDGKTLQATFVVNDIEIELD